jgi:hypothetical protein
MKGLVFVCRLGGARSLAVIRPAQAVLGVKAVASGVEENLMRLRKGGGQGISLITCGGT